MRQKLQSRDKRDGFEGRLRGASCLDSVMAERDDREFR